MVATTTRKTPTKKSSNSKVDEAMTSPTRKMTKEEKAQARARAAEAMGHGGNTKKNPTPAKKKTTPATTSKDKSPNTKATTAVKFTMDIEEVTSKLQDVKIEKTTEDVEQRNDESSQEKSTGVGKNERESIFPEVEQRKQSPVTKPIIQKEYNGIAKLLMVDLQSTNAATVADTMWNLNSYVEHGNVKEAEMLGTASSLILALQKWKANPTIQFYGCQCIRLYAHKSFLNGKATMIKYGGIEVLALAMKTFPENSSLQVEACRALLELASTEETSTTKKSMAFSLPFPLSSSDQREAWSPFVFDHDGVGLVVHVMKMLHDSPDTLADCAYFLDKLLVLSVGANMEEVKNMIRTSRAPTIVFESTQKHLEHSSLKHAGKKLISHF